MTSTVPPGRGPLCIASQALRASLLSACPSGTKAILPSKRLRIILVPYAGATCARTSRKAGRFTGTDTDRHCSERTMSAAVTATGSATQMVSRREYDVPLLVEIEVLLHRGRITCFPARPRKRLKTGPAQAHRMQTIRHQSAKDSTRYSDFFAPARSLVEMTLRQTALVIATTHRTLFGPA
jgi:hypothetical protein